MQILESGSAYGAFACERALRRIKVGRYLLPFQSPNLGHLLRKFMNKLCQSFLIKASTFLSNSSHYSSNCLWTRRTKYSLSHNCPEPFNGPKIVHFRWKPEMMNVAKSKKSWSVVGKVLLHEIVLRRIFFTGVRFLLVHLFFGVAFFEQFFRGIMSKF